MFPMFQLFVVAFFITGLIILFGMIKRKEKSTVAALVICLLLSALVANGILNMVPLPADEVVVTATGTKNKWAGNNEVSIINYLVGGKEYEIRNPTQGKWFWQGDIYKWRNESDPRQPQGTTRSITLQIPYGKDRKIWFVKNWYSGIVEVTYRGESHQYDLYKSRARNQPTLSAPVPDTDSFALYCAKLLRLLLFVLIILALMAFPVFCVSKYEDKIIKMFWQKHWDKIYYLGLAVLYVLLLQKNSVDGSLWGDELWELGYMYTDTFIFPETLHFVLSKFWLKLMPYGQQYLLLLPQLLVAGTIILAGCTGGRVYGKRFGILFSSLVASSLSIVYQCAMEYRVYPYMLFATALMFYTFVKKQTHLGNETYIDVFLHSLAIAIAIDMHPLVVVAVCIMMFGDFVLILQKKSSKKCWLGFILPGICGLIWLFGYALGVGRNLIDYWNSVESASFSLTLPNIKVVIPVITWLMSSNLTMFYLLIFAVVIMSVDIIFTVAKGKFNYNVDYINLMALLMPAGVVAAAFSYLAITGSDILFWDRYFISIAIFLLYITSFGIYKAIGIFHELSNNKVWENSLTISFIAILCIHFWPQVGPWELFPAHDRSKIGNYKGAVEYIMKQDDVYSDDTITMFDHVPHAIVGLQYYITHNGSRDMINCSFTVLDEIDQYNTMYYAYVRQDNSRNVILRKLVNTGIFELQEENQDAKVMKLVRVQNQG